MTEGLLRTVPKCGYGIDVIFLIGERRLKGGRSLPEIHKELETEYGVRISGRHLPNLLKVFLALVHAVNAETDVIKRILTAQGVIILSVDGVAFDDTSPVLYVLRDVLSGEILYSERVERRNDTRIGELLEKVKALGVPIAGVISDKEKAIVSAVEQVLPGVPHQYCHTHFLKNAVKPMEGDLATLGAAVKDITTDIRRLSRELDDQATECESTAAELEVARELLAAAKAAGTTSGDGILAPPPVKRFERLEKVAEAARKAAGKSTGSGGEWVLLNSIVAVLAGLRDHAELARRLAWQIGMIRKISHILESDSSGSQVQRILRTYLNRQVRSAPTRGRGAARGDFIREVSAVAERFWPGLFHCYDIEGLPHNNNDMERMFGSAKRQDRKATGRKSTVGGPLETAAEFVLESWSVLTQRPSVQQRFATISPEALSRARRDIEKIAAPARKKRSIQRNPEKHLKTTLNKWGGS
jgi:hypothetical protein